MDSFMKFSGYSSRGKDSLDLYLDETLRTDRVDGFNRNFQRSILTEHSAYFKSLVRCGFQIERACSPKASEEETLQLIKNVVEHAKGALSKIPAVTDEMLRKDHEESIKAQKKEIEQHEKEMRSGKKKLDLGLPPKISSDFDDISLKDYIQIEKEILKTEIKRGMEELKRDQEQKDLREIRKATYNEFSVVFTAQPYEQAYFELRPVIEACSSQMFSEMSNRDSSEIDRLRLKWQTVEGCAVISQRILSTHFESQKANQIVLDTIQQFSNSNAQNQTASEIAKQFSQLIANVVNPNQGNSNSQKNTSKRSI